MSDTAAPPASSSPEQAPADNPALEAAPGAVSSYATDARPRGSCLFLALPIAFAAAILLGYVVLFGVGSLGIAASGERVTITFDTCADAHELVKARVDMMGLGEPEWSADGDALTLTATLPDTPAADGIPATLARAGTFEVRAGTDKQGELIVGHDGILKAEFSTKELGNPLIIVKMTRQAHKDLEAWMEAHNTEQITVWVDEEPILSRPAEPPFRRQEIDIRAEGEDGQLNMTRAVNWALVITHGPLPCPTRVRETRPVEGG